MSTLPNPFMKGPLVPAPRSRPEPELWLDSSRGQYIPQAFAKSFRDRANTVSGVSAYDWSVLEYGPDHVQYWETWDDLLFRGDVLITDQDGQQYFPYQEGDLWLIPVGMEWDDDADFYVWAD